MDRPRTGPPAWSIHCGLPDRRFSSLSVFFPPWKDRSLWAPLQKARRPVLFVSIARSTASIDSDQGLSAKCADLAPLLNAPLAPGLVFKGRGISGTNAPMTPTQNPSWQQLNESISLKREELRQLEQQAEFMRHRAIAAARNILRAYDVSLDELSVLLEEDAKASNGGHRADRRARRVAAVKAPATLETAAQDASPLSRLPSTVRTVLANQGLRTFEAIAEAVDGGQILHLQRVGPHRRALLAEWLAQERGESALQASNPGPAASRPSATA